jgi:mannosyltransferase OCH1-like enzyme
MINKIIHQIWFTDSDVKIPNSDLSLTFKHYNPSFKYLMWSIDSFTEELESHNELREFLPLYNRIVKMVEKADFAKYCLMWIYGGLYFDLDFICVRSLDDYVETHDWLFCREPKDRSAVGVYSGLMGGQARHEFWLSVLHEMNSRYRYSLMSSETLHMTGPILLHDVLMKTNLPVISCCLFCPLAKTSVPAHECRHTMNNIYTYTNWDRGSEWSKHETYRFFVNLINGHR